MTPQIGYVAHEVRCGLDESVIRSRISERFADTLFGSDDAQQDYFREIQLAHDTIRLAESRGEDQRAETYLRVLEIMSAWGREHL